MREARNMFGCGWIVERTIDLENRYFVDHAIHHTIREVAHVLDTLRIEAQALIKSICCVHRPPSAAIVTLMEPIRVIELNFDKHLLAFTISQFAYVDVNITPVRRDNRGRSPRRLADAEAVAINDFQMEFHAHGPDGHHPTNTPGKATP